MVSFVQPAEQDLEIYAAEAARLYREALAEHPDCGPCGIYYGFADHSVRIGYRVPDGTERIGPVNEANRFKTVYIGRLLDGARELRKNGFKVTK